MSEIHLSSHEFDNAYTTRSVWIPHTLAKLVLLRYMCVGVDASKSWYRDVNVFISQKCRYDFVKGGKVQGKAYYALVQNPGEVKRNLPFVIEPSK